MSENNGGATAPNQAAPDYSAIAETAFQQAVSSHSEGGSNGSNDFDLAFGFAKKSIEDRGMEVDSNALFLALTGEKQKRIKEENPVP